MENDPKFWRTVADRLEDYSIGDCQLQYAWNEYCKDNDVYEQQIFINDGDWFYDAFAGLSLEYLYSRLIEEDYDIADTFAREDDYGNPISSNDRASLISHEEYNALTHWVRVKANKMTKEAESSDYCDKCHTDCRCCGATDHTEDEWEGLCEDCFSELTDLRENLNDNTVVCRRCGSPVLVSINPEYVYYCPEHDEDLYVFETCYLSVYKEGEENGESGEGK